MATRYEAYYDCPGVTATEIIATDERPKWSGLYDMYGRKLHRVPERVPLGYRVSGEQTSVRTRNRST